MSKYNFSLKYQSFKAFKGNIFLDEPFLFYYNSSSARKKGSETLQ